MVPAGRCCSQGSQGRWGEFWIQRRQLVLMDWKWVWEREKSEGAPGLWLEQLEGQSCHHGGGDAWERHGLSLRGIQSPALLGGV